MPAPRAPEGRGTAAAAGPPAVRQAVALPAVTGAPSGALTPAGRRGPAALPEGSRAPAAPHGEGSTEPEATATTTGEATTADGAPATAGTATAGTRPTTGEAATPASRPTTGEAATPTSRPTTNEAATTRVTATGEPATGVTATGEPAAPAGTATATTGGSPAATATATAPAPAPDEPDAGADGAHAGRPKKPLLAAAAIVGSLLITLPFALASDGGRDDAAAGLVTSATTGTVLQDDPSGLPGTFTAESPSASPTASPSASAPAEPEKKQPVKTAQATPSSAGSRATTAPAKAQAKAKAKPAASRKATTAADTRKAAAPRHPGRPLVSAQSGKCLSAGTGKDGTQLRLWTCDGSAAQHWDFRADGTVRSMGMCMDVAWASTEDLTAIQVAHCSGNAAQQFYLNSTQDLVARIAGKCVDIFQADTANGTPAVLFPCSGNPNQTWSKA